MNSAPPPLPPAIPPTLPRENRSLWPALFFLAIGIAPALVGVFLIIGTHYKSSSMDPVLRAFFIADTICSIVSGIGIGVTTARRLWLRLLIALPIAAGLWVINALVGLFAGCALTTPGR